MATQVKIDAKEHPISDVTVYQTDSAVVQRHFSVELKAGQNDVVIGRLPVVLRSDSIRVEIQTKSPTQSLTVFDVVHVPPSYSTTSSYDKGTELETFNEQKAELEARIAAIEGQKNLLEGYSETLKSGRIPNVTTEQLEQFMDIYARRQATIHEEKASLQKEIETIDASVDDILKNASSEGERRRSTGVTVVVLAREDGPVELMLSYLVRRARWSSLYDVRADLSTGSPSIKIEYRANITQNTGEDWDGVALTLSTASPLLASDIPKVQPWRINVLRPPPTVRPGGRKSLGFGTRYADVAEGYAVGGEASRMGNVSDGAIVAKAYRADVGPTVQVSKGAISSTFAIEGLSTIPSDDSSHKVSIATMNLTADLEWITIPRSIPSAFLQCRIKNTSSYQLIAGSSSIFMDGSFVAKSQVPDVSPQEYFSCSLGVDPSVRITYHPQNKVSSWTGGGLMSNKTSVTVFRQRITIKNTRLTSISRLIVQDRVPVSEDTTIKVAVLKPSEKAIGPVTGGMTAGDSATGSISKSGVPTSTLVQNVDKNLIARWAQKDDENGGSGGARGDGVVEWIVSDLRDTIDIELAYEITTPAGVQWADA